MYGLLGIQVPFDSGGSAGTQARGVFLTRLCASSAAAIVVYDTIVTFDREVELIWKKRWSLIKAVYLWFRYFGLLCVIFQAVALTSNNVSDKFCRYWFYWETTSYIVLAFCSEVILILWIWVSHNRSQRLLTFLATCFIVEMIAELVILAMGLQHMEAKVQTVPNMSFCVLTAVGRGFNLLWIPVMVFYIITTLIFIRKGFYAYMFRSAEERFGVVKMVIEHTTLNYLAMTSAYIICSIMWLVADPSLNQIPVCFVLAFSVTDCTRLLINIRRAYYHADDPDMIQSQWSHLSFEVRRFPPITSRRRRQKDSFGFDVDELAVAVEIEVTQQVEEAPDTGQYELQKIDHSINDVPL